MDTWGVDSFENDDAKEWAQAYREMGLFVAKSTMEVALGDFQAGGGVSADVARRAIAAVEAVGFAVGRGSPAKRRRLLPAAPAADPGEAEALVPMARRCIGSHSEWFGTGDDQWGETAAEQRRLAAPSTHWAPGWRGPASARPEVQAAPAPEVAHSGHALADDLRAMVAAFCRPSGAARRNARRDERPGPDDRSAFK